jgi:hypothetical protein
MAQGGNAISRQHFMTVLSELLYPLTLFRQNGGHALPSFSMVEGEDMPEPYRTLLVHHGDMTSRLQSHYDGDIILEVLHREETPQAYRREVVLHRERDNLPVEYGAIEIELDAFAAELREAILQEHLPLGGLLNHYKVKYRSRPKAFILLGPDNFMSEVLEMPGAKGFYGRCNELLGDGDQVLARIVEVLRP